MYSVIYDKVVECYMYLPDMSEINSSSVTTVFSALLVEPLNKISEVTRIK